MVNFSHPLSSGVIPKAELNRQSFLLPRSECSKEHSRKLDKKLGFNIFKIESKLAKNFRHYSEDQCEVMEKGKDPYLENREGWIGLDPQVLLTPYNELAKIFEILKEKDIHSIVDFGCAYGRVGIVSSYFFEAASFVGYELVSKRIKEARRIYELQNLANYSLIECDILDDSFEFPRANLYFIYDFGRIPDLKKILGKLVSIMDEQDFYLVARGEEVQSLILNFFAEFRKENIRKEKNFLIYSNVLKS